MAGHYHRASLHRDQSGRCRSLLFDGRIDNLDDLRRRYAGLHAASDASTLATAAYQHEGLKGLKGLERLIGDWSLVLHDARLGAIVLASDFSGVRPLYYRVSERSVHWSASALRLATGAGRLDEHYAAAFMIHGGCPRRTPYEGVLAVPSGHAVVVADATVAIQSIWSLPIAGHDRKRDERCYDERFRMLFREAVAVRLRTPGPVVAELSGGLDSSAVVRVADELIRDGLEPKTLDTVSYVYDDSLDARYIAEVEQARRRSGTHLSTRVTPLFSAACGSELPGGASPLQYAAAAIAAQCGATTFLTGQGGDLMSANWLDDSLQVVRLIGRGQAAAAIGEALDWSRASGTPLTQILSRAIVEMLPAPVRRIAHLLSARSVAATSAQTSLRKDFLAHTGVADDPGVLSREWQAAPVEQRLRLRELTTARELRVLQAPEPLRHLGYTHPFFHRPLVEFLMTVPAEVLCRPGQPRRLMRRALGGFLPAGVRSRRSKSLFGRPLIDTFAPIAAELLRSETWQVVERGWVDRLHLRSRLELLSRGLPCNSSQLRQILVMECWLQQQAPASSAA
ncbi:MAG: hypothetical protein K2Y23_03625 [Cyanobacteria bacterium]|nr:hypothetical protein [Cyanobacteriota bacterium]